MFKCNSVIGPTLICCHCLYLLDLIQCTNEPNVSIPQLANLLIERTQQHNWVIVFKSLVTVHNLMNYGNEVRITTKCWFQILTLTLIYLQSCISYCKYFISYNVISLYNVHSHFLANFNQFIIYL